MRSGSSDAAAVQLATIVFLGLSFVVLGCLVVENEVNYPAWRVLSPGELLAHHAAVEKGLARTMFPLMALHLVTGAVLLVWPPVGLGRLPVISVLSLFVLLLVVSFAFQVPIHRSISLGAGRAAVDELIRSHGQLRRPVELMASVASFWALWRVARGPA